MEGAIRSLPRKGAGVGLVLASLLVSPPAAALEGEALRLYESGKAALDAGRSSDAVESFRRGLDLVRGDEGDTWQLLLALGLAYEKLGQGSDAIEVYRHFLARTEAHEASLTEKWRERREVVRASVAELEADLLRTRGRVSVVTEPPGALLRIDGRPAGPEGETRSPAGFFLLPGLHRIEATLPGRETAGADVSVEVGRLHPIRLELAALTAAEPSTKTPAPLDRSVPTEVREAPPRPRSRVLPWALLGAGAAAAATGLVFTMKATEARDRAETLALPPEEPLEDDEKADLLARWLDADDDRQEFNATAIALYAVGGALAAGGLVLFLVDGGDEPAASFGVTPAPGGVSARWSFSF